MPATPKRPRKPEELIVRDKKRRQLFSLDAENDDPDLLFILMSDNGFIHPQEARRLHAWLDRYLAWLEAREEK